MSADIHLYGAPWDDEYAAAVSSLDLELRGMESTKAWRVIWRADQAAQETLDRKATP